MLATYRGLAWPSLPVVKNRRLPAFGGTSPRCYGVILRYQSAVNGLVAYVIMAIRQACESRCYALLFVEFAR